MRKRRHDKKIICHGALRKSSGFTLLELIVVIFLITLILGVSVPFFLGGLPGQRLNATARDLSATIRQARNLAQIHGEPQTVTIDLDGKYYGIEGRTTKGIPADIGVMVLDMLAGEVRQGKYSVSARAFGSIEGGTIVLSQDGRSVSIAIDPVGGAVVIK